MSDVLSGIITALLAQGLALFEAAYVGVQVHALAADKAAKAGERGMRHDCQRCDCAATARGEPVQLTKVVSP